ncbi:MAG: glycosyltransferase family 4 protein [Opitutaceae bacterium]|jgi:glycosyltransferase involved in cell wall biosynthesis
MVIVSHPTGNANVRAVGGALARYNFLAEFWTSIACSKNAAWLKMAPKGIRAECLRRSFDLPHERIKTHPWRELVRLGAVQGGFSRITAHERGWACIDRVCHSLDRAVARRLGNTSGVRAVYAYEDAALDTLLAARRRGMAALYDLPIGYWRAGRRLMNEEAERLPEWTSTLTGNRDSVSKLERKDAELAAADAIFVASSFTARTLRDYPGQLAPVKVIPYGFPPVSGLMKPDVILSASRPLKLLFVGGLSQRKGIANMFAAAEALGSRVELTVVGHKAGTGCPALDRALARHRWVPSLPHHEILRLMREHDVLLFPSLFEGFGLVITEAMSQGTPVITTDRTAGGDLIEHGHNGWLVEAGSTASLQAAIETILSNPRQITEVGRAAQETASHRSWDDYGDELVAAIRGLIR